jgi:hypothetical protein
MQLDVTELLGKDSSFLPELASGSVAELGENAGRDTYAYACSWLDSDSELFKTIVKHRRTVTCYLREFGAWDKAEIDSWTDRELVGVLIQDIAGDYRELERFCERYYPGESIEDVIDLDGVELPSSLYFCDGKWYFYVGV